MERPRHNAKRSRKLAQLQKADTAEFPRLNDPSAAPAAPAATALGQARRVKTASAHQGPTAPPAAPAAPAASTGKSRFDTEEGKLDIMFPQGITADPPLADDPLPEAAPPKVLSLAELRRERRRRKNRRLLLITLAVAAVLFWLARTYGSTLATLADLTDSLTIAVSQKGEYPLRTAIAQPRQLQELAGGFVELGDADLLVYSADGTRLRSIQHGYARPAITVGDSRFCLYNRSGTELRVESRTKNLFTLTTAQPILLCQLSGNGNLAVVTRSTRYLAELTVYNAGMDFRYSWAASESEGTPVAVAFANDNHRLAVGCLTAADGALQTTLLFLDINSDEVSASYQADGALRGLQWLSADRLLLAFDDRLELLDASGQLQGSYQHSGLSLQDYDIQGENIALLLSSRAGAQLTLLDAQLNSLCTALLTETANEVCLTRDAVYVAYDNAVEAFGLDGVSQWRTEYDSTVWDIIDARQLLLFTGNTVQLLAAPETDGDDPAASGASSASTAAASGASDASASQAASAASTQ